jgi:acetyl esterase/lipase
LRRPADHIPTTISPEAQAALKDWDFTFLEATLPTPNDLPSWRQARATTEESFRPLNDWALQEYQPAIVSTRLGGVPVLDIKPRGWQESPRLLVYAHGGAYTLQSAQSTLVCSVPVAGDTGLRIISVDYSLAPEARWPIALDQVVAVLRALMAEGHSLKELAIYGDSAGSGLAAGAVLQMRDLGLGMPAAVVLWSPWSDITPTGDSFQTLREADLVLHYDRHLKNSADAYVDPQNQKHPNVSPVYADYRPGFPPTLIQGGTQEIFLSNFVRHYRVLDQAGIPVLLDLYEGMWHVFQAFHPTLPESKLARRKMGQFLKKNMAY